MPKWCYQTLLISGEKDDLVPFANRLVESWHNYQGDPIKGQCELLETFYPMPDDIYRGPFRFDDLESFVLKGQEADDYHEYVAAWTKEQLETAKEKYGEYGWLWYFWSMQHWGSKWSDRETSIVDQNDTLLKLTFRSAWAPLIKGIWHISKDNLLLTFTLDFYDEMYDYPNGGIVVKNGEILSQWEETKETYEKNFAEMFGEPVEGKLES